VHGRIVANLARQLGNQLAGSPCQVFTEGMKLQIADDAIFYPDLLVTCDRADLATEMIFRSPKLVIEVLSPSTQAYDRGLKFAVYRRLPSLQEFVLVDPDTRRIEAFRRNAQNQWVLYDMSDGPALEVASVGCTVPMDQVFDGVDPPAA
jgi:Uma2 family endonuclease